jgi:glycosyltransferase involved in cell wall biosynthesis
VRIAEIAPPWVSVPPRTYGGIELVVSLLTEELVQRGHDVTLVANGDSRTKARLWSAHQASPDLSTMSADPFLEVVHVLGGYLRAGEFDVIHDHTALGPALGAVLDGHPPVVHTLHGPWTDMSRRYLGEVAGRVGLVAISEAQTRHNPDVPYAGVVPNGIDLDVYPYREEKEEFALFLGRCNPEKGPEVAVEVAKQAGLPLKIVMKRAEPHEHEHWEREVAPRLRGDEEVVFNADHDVKVDLLSRARVTLCPIQWEEPFGLVMVESMACGTPVVASPQGAAPELVVDGETGVLAEGLEAMVAAVEPAAACSPSACRRRVAERFSAGAMADGYEGVFARVTGATPAA